MNVNGVLLALSAMTLGSVGFVVVSMPTAGSGGVDADVEAALDRQAKSIDRLSGEIEKLQDRVDRRMASLERRVVSTPTTTSAGLDAGDLGRAAAGSDDPGAASGAGADSPSSLEEAVAARVERSVTESIERMSARQRNRGKDGQWKPPMADLARELGLTAQQDKELRAVFDRGRDETFRLLSTPRGDGGTLIDDLVDDLRGAEDQGAVIRGFFGKLASDKVPGSNQTYLAALGELSEDIRRQIAPHLSADQNERVKSLQVDLLDVKTGHDPSGDYVRRQLGN